MNVDACAAKTTPPHTAEFEFIAQPIAMTVGLLPGLLPAKNTPPESAEFDVIVQSVVVTLESPAEKNAPPERAEFEVIAQLNAITVALTVKMAPPMSALLAEK